MPSVVAYFDSCIFIELLQRSDKDRYDACSELWRKATLKEPELVIVTSTLAITEVNKLPDSKTLPEKQSQEILRFFEQPTILMRAVDRRCAELAHEFTRTHGITNLDALHVAAASLAKVDVLYTYDGCGAKSKRKYLLAHNLKIGDPLLRIETPPDPDAGTLLDKSNAAD